MKGGIPLHLLGTEVQGDVLVPGDDAFEKARQIWNSRLAKVPAAIVRCRGTSDVAAAIRFARRHQIPLSVRSGGHSYAGLGVCEAGLMIDLSDLNEIKIDSREREALVGAGTRWGEFYEAAFQEGLAVAGGTVSSVGVAGFTLGGGSGWLSRRYGLALDNLLSVQVVTAEGEVLRASESENGDLFWGIRGGAGNFGVVTRFEFRLYEATSPVLAGQILYSLEDAGNVLQVYRREMPNAPEDFVCYACAFRVPPIPAFPEDLHGRVVLALMVGHLGNVDEGEEVLSRFRGRSKPLLEVVGPTPYLDLMSSFNAGSPPGQRWYSRAHYLGDISDEAIEVFLRNVDKLSGPLTLAYLEPLGGAVSRVDPGATAFPHRSSPYSFHILAGWMDSSEDERVMNWARSFHSDMEPVSTGGVYVNLLAEDEADRVPAAYGANYARLADLKRKWDPENVFRRNQNIQPR